MRALEIEGLAFRYGRLPAVRDLSLHVEEGDVYGFLGPNGAGKTTTLRLVLGLLRPRRGRIRVFGHDLATARLEALRRLGAHLEGNAFYPYLTGRENLHLFARYYGDPDRRWIDTLLERVGLAAVADRKVRSYSLGMRQRLGLAQALLHRPRFLLLDEPMNGLDPPGVLEIRAFLQELHREEGLTMLLATHRLDEVERLCTRVALIREGRLVVEGPLAELLSPAGEVHCRVRTTDDGRARSVLAGVPGVLEATLQDGSLQVRLQPAARPRLARALLAAGLEVEELSPVRPGLEELFVRYGGGKER